MEEEDLKLLYDTPILLPSCIRKIIQDFKFMTQRLPFVCILFFCFFANASAQKKPAKKGQDDTVKVSITNLKTINSGHPDYGPVISADGEMLVFTSCRPVTEKQIRKNQMAKENIYVAYYDAKKKKWGDVKRMEEPLNQPDRHNSAVALSNHGQKKLLYRADETGNVD
jgi:hypothetical protein